MSFKTKQLYQLFVTQFLETLREPAVLFWGVVFPVLISIGLGLAFTQKSESIYRISIVEGQSTQLDSLLKIYGQTEIQSGKSVIIWKITDTTLGNTRFIFSYRKWDEAIVALKRGETDLIVTDGASQYHFDPHNSQSQLVYMKLSALINNPELESDTDTNVQSLTLKGVRYIDFLVPGLIALGMMNGLLWGVSYSVIEKRSQKLLRRMVATPMKKSNYLIALISVRFVMNCVEAGVLFFFAWLFFGSIIQGNLGALIVFFISGNVAFAGIAVLLGCRTAKLETGNGLINAVNMPMMILSGIFFSYQNFPAWSIGFIKFLPLTLFTDGLRHIFNEGAGWAEVATPSLVLSSLGIICFVAGVKWFKWF
ncbi:MAG: ABC transporter permease [Tannerella sp.]|jgi:ABC-type multidrug transport system permease subunit|nr:ABC transporter permease [Tannerella sp.]